jgi:uncharacterized protein YbjT (DUF2867 family)
LYRVLHGGRVDREVRPVATRILVTGATGTLGREVVRQLAGGDLVVRVLSRRPRRDDLNAADPLAGVPEWAVGDLGTGEGIDAALAGVDTIIHCASDQRRAKRDLPGVRRFLDAARRAGVAHLVYISIVGVDLVPVGYYRVKLTEERMIEDSGVAWTVLRATQFHDLVRVILATLARSPVMPIPSGVSAQPIDVRDVAARLVELAARRPAGRAPDLGGPQIRAMADLAACYLRAAGKRRLVLPVRLPGRVFRAYRQGGHLTPANAAGRRTFDEYLAEQPTV